MKKIIIFASGSGSNAENIILHFSKKKHKIAFEVFTNNSNAKVIERATNLMVPVTIFNKQQLQDGEVLALINQFQPDLIVLAGFLWKFPENIISNYPNKIINIHPALLPKYGGKGMYGIHVHQAVLAHQETETGITIHYVNEHYDEGAIIFQESIGIEDCTSAEAIAQKIHTLEHQYFPQVITYLLEQQ